LDRGRVEEVTLNDFRAFLAKIFGPAIKFVDKCADRNALLDEKCCDKASGGALLTSGGSCD
jgi:hypothetical protein